MRRGILILFSLFVGVALLQSCGDSGSDSGSGATAESDALMKKAVETSMRAGRFYEEGRLDSANQVNYDALNMFMKVLETDSLNAKAMSAVGFSYMMASDYEVAMPWFTRALAIDSTLAEARRQLGIALIAEGQVPQGKRQIRESLELVDLPAARQLTLRSLNKIGTEAYQIGAIFGKEGDTVKMRDLTYYSLGVLGFAHQVGGPDSALGLKIAEYARSVGDEETAQQFEAAYNNSAENQ